MPNSTCNSIQGQQEMTYPVPVHVNSRLTAIKCQVASRELLISKECTVLSAIKGQVCHEATAAVVHEDSLLLRVSLYSQIGSLR